MSTLGHIWTAQSCMDKQKWNSLKLLLESCQAKNRQERLLAICLFMRCICENNATFWTISVWIAKITFYLSNFFFFFFFFWGISIFAISCLRFFIRVMATRANMNFFQALFFTLYYFNKNLHGHLLCDLEARKFY